MGSSESKVSSVDVEDSEIIFTETDKESIKNEYKNFRVAFTVNFYNKDNKLMVDLSKLQDSTYLDIKDISDSIISLIKFITEIESEKSFIILNIYNKITKVEKLLNLNFIPYEENAEIHRIKLQRCLLDKNFDCAYNLLKDEKTWIFLRFNKVNNMNTDYLLLKRYDLLFEKSLRPIPDMNVFKPKKLKKKNKNFEYIPVIRYNISSYSDSEGMYSRKDINFCGTFYYLEPESEIFLRAKKIKKYFNRIDAYKNLIGEDVFYRNFIREAMNSDIFIENTPESFDKWFFKGDTSVLKKTEGFYNIDINGMHGARFDESLCDKANELGIEVLIFQNEPEYLYNNSTEIMDVRKREISFKNLFIIKKD